MAPRLFAAVDIGASAGRVVAGQVEGGRITTQTVARFENGVIDLDGHLRWDLTRLYGEVLAGLERVGGAESVGVDTWGVDYGLLDADGTLLAEPVSYRDDRATKVVDDVHALVPPEDLYAVTGVQFLPFNTIYQLAAEQRCPLWSRASHAVLLPDLLAFWLTGELRSELTNASTTGLLDVRTERWSSDLLHRLGIPPDLLPPIEAPGQVRGRTSSAVPVITVGSHDTASAVVGVPATTDRFAYIACGTWSLVGLELDQPVLTEEARLANFTNETGLDGRTRFLHNTGGLWLLQECVRAWGHDDLEALLDEAARLPPGGPTIDVDDPSFIPPGRMPVRIAAFAGVSSLSKPATVRCILDSLATAYARAVREAATLTGATVDVIHVVGGGSQNGLLCQLTADAAGLPVIAGPVEATAVGNIAVQARTVGALPTSLEAIRSGIAASTALRRYHPS